MKVLIIGGGIGGLTTALCCAHHGHDVTVLEQSPTLGEVGAGIQIPPNAMKIFEALGIEALITENAFRPHAIETRMGESGKNIFTIPLGETALKRWGAPYLHIHRGDYIAALQLALHQCQPHAVKLGAKVESYKQDADAVTVILSDGQKITGDILVGADGIHAATRTQMLGPDKPVFTGNVAWRAVVPIEKLGTDLPPPTACAWMGKGRHAVTYLLRQGRLANFVGVVERTDWEVESWHEEGQQEEALRDFAGWHPNITRIIEEADTLFRWALFDRAPLASWTDGRVALLGDAAHPMLPFMAQGAAMAVEDAWAVAAEISKPGRNVAASLLAYQHRRFNRTAMAQAASRANAKTFHQRTVLGQITTYGPMWLAGQLAPSFVHSRMDRFYGHDETTS